MTIEELQAAFDDRTVLVYDDHLWLSSILLVRCAQPPRVYQDRGNDVADCWVELLADGTFLIANDDDLRLPTPEELLTARTTWDESLKG